MKTNAYRVLGQALLGLLLLAGSSAFALAAPDVSIATKVEKEIQVTDANGVTRTERVSADTVLPGETLFFTLTFSNSGDEPATSVKLDNPVPEGTAYVGGSAWGDGAEILFSIDNGQTYKKPARLTYQVNGDESQAAPEQYTNIRWLIETIPAGSSGEAGFSALVK